MSIVSAIQVGQRANPLEMGTRLDPAGMMNSAQRMSAFSSRGVPSPTIKTRRDPGQIHQDAAMSVFTSEMMAEKLKQEQLKTRQMTEAAINTENETYWKRQREMEKTQKADEDQARSEQYEHQKTRYSGDMSAAGMWKGMDAARVKSEYTNALQRSAMGDFSALIQYVNRYGNEASKIKSITADPSGSGDLLVDIDGQEKPLYLKANQVNGFMAGFSPDFHAKALEAMDSSAKAKIAADTKEKDLAIKGKTLDIKEAEARGKEWDATYNPTGIALTAKRQQERQAYVNQGSKGEAATPDGGKAAISTDRGQPGQPPTAPGEVVKAKTEKPPVEGARKAKDGSWYVQKDGKWNRVVAEAKTEGRAAKETEKPQAQGTISYTDPKTGEKVKATVNADGSVRREGSGGDDTKSKGERKAENKGEGGEGKGEGGDGEGKDKKKKKKGGN